MHDDVAQRATEAVARRHIAIGHAEQLCATTIACDGAGEAFMPRSIMLAQPVEAPRERAHAWQPLGERVALAPAADALLAGVQSFGGVDQLGIAVCSDVECEAGEM